MQPESEPEEGAVAVASDEEMVEEAAAEQEEPSVKFGHVKAGAATGKD